MSQSGELSALSVSVIVPCYNSNLEWLAECLFSVVLALEAYEGEGEVLVVDDGSAFCIESGVRKILTAQALSRIRFCRKANGGLSSARNYGMRHTEGLWCHFIDDDDVIDREFYQKMVRHMVEGQADLCFAESRFFGKNEKYFRIATGNIVPRLLIGNVVHVNAALGRRSMLERLGGFDESLNGLEDWDMWLRCVRAGAKVTVVHIPLASVRIHPTSMSTNRPRMNSRMAELSMREWRDYFNFWSTEIASSSSPDLLRDGAFAGFSYALRSETPIKSALQFHRILRSHVGVFSSSKWLLRQTIKHFLKPGKSEHTFK